MNDRPWAVIAVVTGPRYKTLLTATSDGFRGENLSQRDEMATVRTERKFPANVSPDWFAKNSIPGCSRFVLSECGERKPRNWCNIWPLRAYSL